MGFDVDRQNKIVTVDHSHNNFATTSIEGNPKVKIYSNLTVIGVLKRNKGASKKLRSKVNGKKIEGDNSPMLYALKNMDDLTTTQSDVRSLFRNVRQILQDEIPKHGLFFDHIITMPSSHKLASVFAQMTWRICYKLGHPVSHLDSIIRKASGKDVKAQVLTIRDSKKRTSILGNVKKFLKEHDDDTDFQIKYIKKTRLRNLVELLALVPEYEIDHRPVSILLVDDMITTGSTLVAARDLVKQRFPNAEIYAVCLFSAS